VALVLVRSMLQLLVTVNIVPSSLIHFTLMIKAIRSSETSVITRATRCDIPEECILLSPIILFIEVKRGFNI
jgi:hypothetical protein